MFLYFKNELLKRLLSCFSNTAIMILLKQEKALLLKKCTFEAEDF